MEMTNEQHITIKGTSDGLIINIYSGRWSSILAELDDKLSKKADFFKGGRVSLIVGNRILKTDDIKAVGDLLNNHQMTLWSVQSSVKETQTTTEEFGLEMVPSPLKAPTTPKLEPNHTTQTFKRTLRSGQHVEYAGNIVIIGDVNPGAKVMAGGNIIVWGHLRGTAHAGAIIGDSAYVCALKLIPVQLIIGNHISCSPTDNKDKRIIPEMAFVSNGQIIAESWE